MKIVIDTSTLAAWRADHERLEAEAAAERAADTGAGGSPSGAKAASPPPRKKAKR